MVRLCCPGFFSFFHYSIFFISFFLLIRLLFCCSNLGIKFCMFFSLYPFFICKLFYLFSFLHFSSTSHSSFELFYSHLFFFSFLFFIFSPFYFLIFSFLSLFLIISLSFHPFLIYFLPFTSILFRFHQVRSYDRNIAVNVWFTHKPGFKPKKCDLYSSKEPQTLDKFKFSVLEAQAKGEEQGPVDLM